VLNFLRFYTDEGAIIDQDIIKVNHSHNPKQLTEMGAAIECVVLARSIKWWAERRIFLNGNKTVVFS
jgi:formyltetrahydrofolate deformylase